MVEKFVWKKMDEFLFDTTFQDQHVLFVKERYHRGIERCIHGSVCADASSWTHLQPDASTQMHLQLDASTRDASMLNFDKCVLFLLKRIDPSACSAMGLIRPCLQLDAFGTDESGQMRLARDASSWMHSGEKHLAGCIYTDASMDASFDSAMMYQEHMPAVYIIIFKGYYGTIYVG